MPRPPHFRRGRALQEGTRIIPEPAAGELPAMDGVRAALSAAREALRGARTVEEIKAVRDEADAAQKYSHSAMSGVAVENEAAELRLRAERKAGLLLRKMHLRGGDRRSGVRREHTRLEDLGITHNQSHRWQVEALIPQDQFERYIRRAKRSGESITAAGLTRFAEQVAAQNQALAGTAESIAARIFSGLRRAIGCGAAFPCIYARPPWFEKDRVAGGEPQPPPRLVEHLTQLPVRNVAADNSHLYLWAANGWLPAALRVMKSWGFVYRHSFVRLNPKAEQAEDWAVSRRLLLLGVRGGPAGCQSRHKNQTGADGPVALQAEDDIRQFIEQLSGGPYLELFGREARSGWTVLA